MQILFSLVSLLLCCLPIAAEAQATLNIYAWTNEIPETIVRQFEKETGIKVNLANYENNEIMYAKMRASKEPGYDIIMPSSYFVDRMRKQNMLEKLDKTKLPHLKNLADLFTHPAYDPELEYSIPFIWGITGIFYNDQYYSKNSLLKWSDLWNKKFENQLMLLDDSREIFSMALLSLHHAANDANLQDIKQAYLQLKSLSPNIKVFSTETVVSIMIDEDATVGMAWNGDVLKAQEENSHIQFVFPEEGFVIWVDNLAVSASAPHKKEAYLFLNFLLRPDIAKQIALITRFPITNEAGRLLLPSSLRNNSTIYPSKEVLKRGQFQTDMSNSVLARIEEYWEELKVRG